MIKSNKKIILTSFLLLAVIFGLGIATKQFNVRVVLAAEDQGETQSHQIQVHPEILGLQESFANVAESVKPAVVNISVARIEKYQVLQSPFEFFFWDHDDFFEDFFNFPHSPNRRRQPQGQKYYEKRIPGGGSGVIIDPDGYILTNEHVVREANEIKVTLPTDPNNKLDGKVIGRDERTDLAVIKINGKKGLPYAKLGDSDKIRVGDWAMAIGSPFGLEQTVTVGIVSATRQNFSIQGRNYKNFIQTDAAINPGNSGGPLVNIKSEVIGINTAIFTPSGGFAGIGFAIPSNQAKEIVPQLREKGKVVRGWIGVNLEGDIDEATAKVFDIPNKEGALIYEVLPGYPAEKAGLQRGDVIIEFEGKKIKNNQDLKNAVGTTPPNKKVEVKVIRNKKKINLDLTTAEAPASMSALSKDSDQDKPDVDEKSKEKWLGSTIIELTPDIRQRYAVGSEEKGVGVIAIEQGSKAEQIGLMEGDIIRAVNQQPVSDLSSFKQAVKRVNNKEGVVLDILRRGQPIFLSYMGE